MPRYRLSPQTGLFGVYFDRYLKYCPSKNRINTEVSNSNRLYQNCSPEMSLPYKKDFFRRICVRDLNPRNLFAMVYDNCLLITGFEISGLNRQIAFLSIVFGVKLKETLRMITGRTNIRGLSADDDMTAVTAFPNFDLALFKYPSGCLQQLPSGFLRCHRFRSAP